jgi:hypothetical protein
VRVKSYRDVLNDYQTNPEAKSLGPDGLPCHRETTGLLTRRPVTVDPSLVIYIGKEANRLEDTQAGLSDDETIVEYPDPSRHPWDATRRALADLPTPRIAQTARLSERAARDIKAGRARPRAGARRRLARLADPGHVSAAP